MALNAIQLLKNSQNAAIAATIGLLRIKKGNRLNNCNQNYPSAMFRQPKFIFDAMSYYINLYYRLLFLLFPYDVFVLS